jgi:hypothetical protein
MRKAWRKKKREAAAAAANAQYAAGWNRASLASSSCESDYDRRDSTTSLMSSSSEYPLSAYSWDSRPTTSSSVASSVDSRGYVQSYSQPYGMMNGNSSVSRRDSAPQHIPLPVQQPQQGFRLNDGDHPTPTPQNPFPGPARQNAFPFQALTQPMPVQAGANPGYAGQFAFQR